MHFGYICWRRHWLAIVSSKARDSRGQERGARGSREMSKCHLIEMGYLTHMRCEHPLLTLLSRTVLLVFVCGQPVAVLCRPPLSVLCPCLPVDWTVFAFCQRLCINFVDSRSFVPDAYKGLWPLDFPLPSTCATTSTPTATSVCVSLKKICCLNIERAKNYAYYLLTYSLGFSLFADHVREFTCGKLYYRTFHMNEERDSLYVGAM